MITPKFKLEQDPEFLTVVIHAPYIKAQSVDLLVEGNEIRFHVAPYFLRLTLPGNVVEDDRSNAKYDISTGEFTITVPKETPGETFPDLDLLSKLLAKKSELNPDSTNARANPKPLIEVLSSTTTEVPPSQLIGEDEDFDWELPQEFPAEPTLTLGKVGYGFNSSHSGYFDHVQEMPNEINEIPAPETTSFSERRRIRIELEDEKFDEDYYIGDFMSGNEPEFQEILKYKTPWARALKDIQKGLYSICDPKTTMETEQVVKKPKPLIQEIVTETDVDGTVGLVEKMDQLKVEPLKIHPQLEFTDKDRQAMMALPQREYLLDIHEARYVYLGLVDLMLCYSYDLRTTQGEPSVESSWTIGKLCSTMACLDRFNTVSEVLVAHRRRVLAYPLYRHFELGESCVRDTYMIFKLGRRALLRSLLELKHLFDHHDVHYRYSKILLDDYALWIQTNAKDEIIRSLSHQLRDIKVAKEDILGWDLEELEAIAATVEPEME